ncbi:MAG: 30S ribosomal protein S12 methylthiotransferase RimO [Ectothiorhodospiraceae bacterium]|nr:30S ribosomal protein S12 methylthiotransferase RimO [Ectothiorhodospiraceae bacterium]
MSVSSDQLQQHAAPRIGFVSLGCPKALVDSERILTQLRTEGYQVVGGYQEADLVVVNICGFIEAAQEESLDAIGEALTENGKVVVTGCLGVKESVIRDRFPEVLAITGPHDYEAVMTAVHAQLTPPARNPFTDLLPDSGIKLTPRHYAYLKISEGCNHKCTFCIIPDLRGRLGSRRVDEVLAEAHRLVRDGVRELLVVSQDTSAYGVDRRYEAAHWQQREWRSHMTDLSRALGELGIWIRLHYVYPYPHVDELIPLMADGAILPYLDMPLQHASPRILKAMRRPAGGEAVLERIRRWREICPELVIRSTFIVGFPGETEEDFQELMDFLREAQLDRVGCFTYSPVEGARANELPDAVPTEVAQRRKRELMELQADISAAGLARFVGQVMQVLVDEVDGDGAVARSYADAPEIDGLVHLRGAAGIRPGQFADVLIEEADAHDLYGAVLR